MKYNTADTLGNSGPAKSPIRVTKYRDLKDKYVGAPGTTEREQFEFELSLELIPLKIKEYRKQQNLTQSELGALIGVQKTQISKLETNAVNVTLDTLLKVFGALHTKIKLSFEPGAAV
jgi:HTH-type transcriptional regulator/antitoxin HipB